MPTDTQEYFAANASRTTVFELDSFLFKRGISGLEIDTQSYILESYLTDSVMYPSMTQYIWENKFVSRSEPYATSYMIIAKSLDANRALYTENNLMYIPIVFPIQSNIRWDGLSFITEDSVQYTVLGETIKPFKDWDQFRIIETDGTYTYGDTTFTDVVSVLQTDSENAIEKRYSLERFAKGVGLIYREQWILDTQNITDDPWEQKAEKGFILIQTFLTLK